MFPVQAIIEDIKALRLLDAASLAQLETGGGLDGGEAEETKTRLRTSLAEYDQALEILSGI